jgi:hypothetical protein
LPGGYAIALRERFSVPYGGLYSRCGFGGAGLGMSLSAHGRRGFGDSNPSAQGEREGENGYGLSLME